MAPKSVEHIYREFACWAARRAYRIVSCCPCENVLLAVERFLDGQIDFGKVRAVREANSGGVSGAGVCGVPRGIPSAAVQIAAWQTANDSAEMSARQVIHSVALAAGFVALGRAASIVALNRSESTSSWRNHYIWRRDPQIMDAAILTERAILEGELQQRLGGGDVLWVDRGSPSCITYHPAEAGNLLNPW